MADQGEQVVSDELSSKMDEILNVDSDEVSEDATDETVEENIDNETVESEDETVDASEEAEETEEEVEPEAKVKPKPQRKTDDVVSKEIEEIKFDLDPDLIDPQVIAALNKTAESLNSQQKIINEEKESLRLEREKVFETRIDSCFDSYEKDLPRLGSVSKKLTEDNGIFRREVFSHAQITAQMHRIPIEDAI